MASASAMMPTTAAAATAAIKNIGLTSNAAVNEIVDTVAAPTPAVNAPKPTDEIKAFAPTANKPIAIGARYVAMVAKLSKTNFTIGVNA